MTHTTSCPDCPWSIVTSDKAAALRLTHTHYDTTHAPQTEALVVTQFPGVTWQEEFIHAVTAIPIGVEFTTADLHGRIPDPPHSNHWGGAMTVAASLGLCKPVDVQKSTLESTKGSRLLRWVRTVQSSRGAA